MAEPPNPSRQRVFGRKYEEHTLAGIVCLLNAANFTVPSTLNYRDGRRQLPAPAQHESLKAAFWIHSAGLSFWALLHSFTMQGNSLDALHDHQLRLHDAMTEYRPVTSMASLCLGKVDDDRIIPFRLVNFEVSLGHELRDPNVHEIGILASIDGPAANYGLDPECRILSMATHPGYSAQSRVYLVFIPRIWCGSIPYISRHKKPYKECGFLTCVKHHIPGHPCDTCQRYDARRQNQENDDENPITLLSRTRKRAQVVRYRYSRIAVVTIWHARFAEMSFASFA
ncbi:hypothetical protein B0J14DRAFT_635104 [Halenospora varia]|nr:hypothetical protein B0J14DRAFT_635104 [Halenospora varia]